MDKRMTSINLCRISLLTHALTLTVGCLITLGHGWEITFYGFEANVITFPYPNPNYDYDLANLC